MVTKSLSAWSFLFASCLLLTIKLLNCQTVSLSVLFAERSAVILPNYQQPPTAHQERSRVVWTIHSGRLELPGALCVVGWDSGGLVDLASEPGPLPSPDQSTSLVPSLPDTTAPCTLSFQQDLSTVALSVWQFGTWAIIQVSDSSVPFYPRYPPSPNSGIFCSKKLKL